MDDRYLIRGISRSWRRSRGTPTVVMPILIVLVLGGLVTFFLLSRPGKTLDRITSRAPEEEPALRAVPVAEAPAPDPSNPESPEDHHA